MQELYRIRAQAGKCMDDIEAPVMNANKATTKMYQLQPKASNPTLFWCDGLWLNTYVFVNVGRGEVRAAAPIMQRHLVVVQGAASFRQGRVRVQSHEHVVADGGVHLAAALQSRSEHLGNLVDVPFV